MRITKTKAKKQRNQENDLADCCLWEKDFKADFSANYVLTMVCNDETLYSLKTMLPSGDPRIKRKLRVFSPKVTCTKLDWSSYSSVIVE